MKSVGLVEIFCPVKETNRTHSRGYVEDLSTQTGRKRCTKTAVLNLSVLPKVTVCMIWNGCKKPQRIFDAKKATVRKSLLRTAAMHAHPLYVSAFPAAASTERAAR